VHRNVCVVVPVYNKGQAVAAVIEELAPRFGHIICVDDGSSDSSAAEVAKTSARLIKHRQNRGQGAALQTGIDAALADPAVRFIVTFDADGQHRVRDAERMVRFMKENSVVDIVLGSRFLGGGEAKDIGFIKLRVLRLAVIFSNLTTGLKLTDTHNGLRVMHRDCAAQLHLRSARMAHASEIIYKIARNNWVYRELPVTILYTDYAKAQGQSVWNSFNILAETLKHKALRSWRA
jgi:polyprenyl-phospho-N-acetylgalactosaminyl synthase